MKALTIKQPWATLIMQDNKRLAKYIPEDMPTGKILGKVTLVNCAKMTSEFRKMLLKENKEIYKDSSFKENYGWQIENVEVFDEPIDAKGKLGLWEYGEKRKNKEINAKYNKL